MKRAIYFLIVLVGFRLTGSGAQTQYLTQQSQSSSSQEVMTTYQAASNPNSGANLSSGRVVDRLTDILLTGIKPNGAGVEMDTSKKMAPEVPPAPTDSEWFSHPAVYGDYQFISTNDRRPSFFDGDINVVQAGFDFETVEGIIVGALYTGSVIDEKNTFGNDNREEGSSHFFNFYAAKSFADWITVGTTVGYGKTFLDQTFGAPGGGRVQDESDNYTLTPFIGAFHTFGAWSFASTPTFILQTASNGAKTTVGTFVPQVDQSSSLLSWRNKVEYAITDKWTIALKADYNQVLTQYGQNNPAPPTSYLRADDNWVTFGPKLIWYPNDNWEVTLAYETDLFDNTYDNHRGTLGLTYSF